jgi:hypothetical protein
LHPIFRKNRAISTDFAVFLDHIRTTITPDFDVYNCHNAPLSIATTVTPTIGHHKPRRTAMTDTVTPIKKAKQRAAELSTERMSVVGSDQQSAIRQLANDLHRLNHAVMRAVDAGVSVELVRSARHHGGEGNWGDMMVPVIVKG